MQEHLMKQILLSNGFWVLNKEVTKSLGVVPSLMLSILAEADSMFADEEGWFYQTSETIENLSGISTYQQTRAIEKLKKLGIVLQENKGMPMRRCFKIDYEATQKLVFKKLQNQFPKNSKTSFVKTAKNKEHIYIKNNINKDNVHQDALSASNKQEDIENLFLELWKLYPLKKGKRSVSKKSKKAIYELGKDKFIQALDRYKAYVQSKDWLNYKNGSTFFNSGYIDYLDDNYTEATEEQPENKGKKVNRNFLNGDD